MFKKSFMATWDELDGEDYADKDIGESNLALMALTSSETNSKSCCSAESKNLDEVLSNSCHSNFLFIHDPISCCKDKVRHMKILERS